MGKSRAEPPEPGSQDDGTGRHPAQLIDSLYALLSEPTSFETLIHALSDNYARALDRNGAEDLGALKEVVNDDLGDYERHFDRAAVIFDQLKHSLDPPTENQPSDETAAHPILLIDTRGIISFANLAARRDLDLQAGNDLTDLPVDADIVSTIRRHLTDLRKHPGSDIFVFLPAHHPESENRMLFTLQRNQNAEGGCDGTIRLQGIGLGWSMEAGSSFCHTFGLTAAEQDVLRGIVEGQSLAEIAGTRCRSILTVRGQAKALLKKTGARSQVEIVRMFAAISLALTENGDDSPDQAKAVTKDCRTEFVEVAKGRRVQVDLMGPEDGLPVIMMHGLVSGTQLTPSGHEALYKHGLRIIAPWRPYYAGSDPLTWSFKDFPFAVAQDIKHLMAHYGIGKTVLVGRFSGAIYAAAAAKFLGPSVAGIVNVSGTPPIRHRSQLDVIAPWQRMYAYSARYFPAAIPVLTRGALQLIVKHKSDEFFAGMYQSPDADVRTSREPHARAVVGQGWRSTLAQGSKGYEIDVRHTARDWSDYYDGLKQPAMLIHGRQDPVTTIDQVEDLVRLFPFLKLVEVADGGQLLFYSHPDFIIRSIAEFSAPLLRG